MLIACVNTFISQYMYQNQIESPNKKNGYVKYEINKVFLDCAIYVIKDINNVGKTDQISFSLYSENDTMTTIPNDKYRSSCFS